MFRKHLAKLRHLERIVDHRCQIEIGQRQCVSTHPPLFGNQPTSVELRYLHFEEKINTTFAGVRFHNMSGLVQRQVERFVYQLQREARRFDKDDDF